MSAYTSSPNRAFAKNENLWPTTEHRQRRYLRLERKKIIINNNKENKRKRKYRYIYIKRCIFHTKGHEGFNYDFNWHSFRDQIWSGRRVRFRQGALSLSLNLFVSRLCSPLREFIAETSNPVTHWTSRTFCRRNSKELNAMITYRGVFFLIFF